MKSAIRLLQLSDPHLYGNVTGTLRGVVTRSSLQSVLHHAHDRIAAADAILLTGDLVNDDPAGYATVRELLGSAGRPVWCLPGNHDDPAVMRRELAAAPFQVGGFHDLGIWRIVLLDSCVPGEAHGQLGDAELARLESALAGAGERHVLVALHHHPVPMGSRWIDSVALRNPQALFAVTERYTRVRAMVWGHVHQQHDSLRGAVRMLARLQPARSSCRTRNASRSIPRRRLTAAWSCVPTAASTPTVVQVESPAAALPGLRRAGA